MASKSCSAFSNDGKYFAHCGNDGILKIWETTTSRLKQEYSPNLHLSLPYSFLTWISVTRQSNTNSTSPWKKRRRKSVSEDGGEDTEMVAMGSTNGKVIIYDIASSSVSRELVNGHSGTITAIDWSKTRGLYTAGEDKYIVEWNLKDNKVQSKWKSGKDKVTAIVASPDEENSLITAGRIIKWWDLERKRVIMNFPGHATQINCLTSIRINDGSSFVISGATGDRQLNVWALDKDNTDKSSVAILAMQDDPASITAQVVGDSQIEVLAVTKSGQAQLFKHQPNGRGSKPLKPALSVSVNLMRKETAKQTPILAGKLTEDSKLLLAYGSYVMITFETVAPDFSDKIQRLVRADVKNLKERNVLGTTKIKPMAITRDVEYLVAATPNTATKRNRPNAAGSQLPMEIRLENLSLKMASNTPGETPTKATNMAQLLMQGLHSKDKTILRDVLMRRDETLIQNTVSRLPVETIAPLLKELTVMLQGKTYATKIAVTWLKILIKTFAGHLLSYPDIGDLLGPILGTVDAKLNLLPQLCRLKGRVSLVTGQISQASQKQDELNGESLLVYQEPDSSDEESEVEELAMGSESDEIWEEASDQDINQDLDDGNDQQDEDGDGDGDDISMSS